MQFRATARRSTLGTIFNLAELTYVSTVRKVRQGHRNALMAVFMQMMQAFIFILVFYLMFAILGTRTAMIRGDFMIYLVTGIFIFLTHVRALGAVAGSEGPTAAMMQHAPMNTIVAIASSALSSLYISTLTFAVMLLCIHVALNPVVIEDWTGLFFMYLLGWATGVAIGMVFLALKPWFPDAIGVVQTLYTRANMIASGKMFVANTLPSSMIAVFDWNPLFHLIDQARGFAFKNYFPHYSNWEYPIYITVAFLMLGLMGEFYTRKHASASWQAGR